MTIDEILADYEALERSPGGLAVPFGERGLLHGEGYRWVDSARRARWL